LPEKAERAPSARCEIGVFLLLGTVCPRHLLYPVLPSCPFSRAFPYPQPGDAGGCRSAPAGRLSATSRPAIHCNCLNTVLRKLTTSFHQTWTPNKYLKSLLSTATVLNVLYKGVHAFRTLHPAAHSADVKVTLLQNAKMSTVKHKHS